MVLDSYIEATGSSPKMATDYNGNLDTQLILETLIQVTATWNQIPPLKPGSWSLFKKASAIPV